MFISLYYLVYCRFIDEPTDRELDVIARFLEDIVDVEVRRRYCMLREPLLCMVYMVVIIMLYRLWLGVLCPGCERSLQVLA